MLTNPRTSGGSLAIGSLRYSNFRSRLISFLEIGPKDGVRNFEIQRLRPEFLSGVIR